VQYYKISDNAGGVQLGSAYTSDAAKFACGTGSRRYKREEARGWFSVLCVDCWIAARWGVAGFGGKSLRVACDQ